jgi:hypothetical protein
MCKIDPSEGLLPYAHTPMVMSVCLSTHEAIKVHSCTVDLNMRWRYAVSLHLDMMDQRH